MHRLYMTSIVVVDGIFHITTVAAANEHINVVPMLSTKKIQYVRLGSHEVFLHFVCHKSHNKLAQINQMSLVALRCIALC
jgi:hypothetical protein